MKDPVQQTVEVPTAEVTAKLQTQVQALAAKIAVLESALIAAVEQIKPEGK